MINPLRSIFPDRRKDDTGNIFGTERRKPTLKEASDRLARAAQELHETVTIWPEQVKDLLERMKK